jgi:hypothetical protein
MKGEPMVKDRRVARPGKALWSTLWSIRKEDEDATVVYLLQKRLERLPERHGEDVHKAFADVEFKERLRQYGNWANLWRVAQVGIWLTVASLGLLGSVLAAVESGHIIAVVAGSLVAILTTFAQAARPGLQADGYTNAKRAMRDEAWDFLSGTGDRYKGLKGKRGRRQHQRQAQGQEDDEEAFKLFAKQIREIVKAKRSATQFQLQQ